MMSLPFRHDDGGRFPRGKRGLKSVLQVPLPQVLKSLPSREAWIEIYIKNEGGDEMLSRFPRGKRGLKSDYRRPVLDEVLSLPSREAWIEIHIPRKSGALCLVASLAGSVD